MGLGGLGWGVCFEPLFFQPFWFQPSGEGFTPPPTPALKCPPLSVFFVFENHCFEGIAGQVSWRPLGTVWDPCGLQNRVWMAKNRINFQSKINASLNRFLERFLIYWGVFGTTFSYRFLWVWKAKLGGQTEPGDGQKRAREGRLGAPGGLWGSLGGPWPSGGPSWAILEPGSPPGARRFGASWGRLGALLGPSGALLAFKIDSGWLKNRFKFRSKN